MNKAKIKAASYRNMRKAATKKRNEDLGSTIIDNSCVIMDPIEEVITNKKDEISTTQEEAITTTSNKENLKRLLQTQLKTHINEPKVILNKSNNQLVSVTKSILNLI